MRQSFVTPLLVGLFLCLGGCAAAAKLLYPVNSDPLKSKPGVYTLDPAHANVIFSVNHLGFSFHHGRFNTIEGSLDLNADAPNQSKVYVRIDAGSIDTNSNELDNKLRATSMFNVAAHPYIVFESDVVSVLTENTARITGYLTMAGARRPFEINATFIGSGKNPLTGQQTVGFSGEGSLQRSTFGLSEWLPFVGDEVSFIIEAEFTRPN